jgi:GH3 auxin-responsive promoter
VELPRPLAGLFDRAVAWRFASIAQDQASPVEAQERAYRRLHARLRGTEVGRLTGLSAAPDLRLFAASVPARDYAFFADLVARVVDRGERDVLFPGKPVFVGLSSGTTGSDSKRVVHDRASIALFDEYELTLGTVMARDAGFNPLLHNRLSWGAAATVTRTRSGVEQGYISGYMAAHPKRIVRHRTFPSAEISHIADLKEKIRAAAPELRRRPIHLASAVPTYLVSLLEELRGLWGVEDLSRVWPDFRLIMYGGTAIHPFRAQLAKLVGRPVKIMGMYVATEGPLGYEIPSLNGGESGVFSFHLSSIVFTFRKVGGDGKILTMEDLWPGDEVELLLTTPNGLVNYRIGDCLKIRSTRPLLFEITGRVGVGLNVAAEKATLGELAKAAARAGDASATLVRHYFVCPGLGQQAKPCYAWTLLVDQPEAVDRRAVLEALDRAMKEENGDYRGFRDEGMLDPPRLHLLPASVARAYFDRDAHRGQLKMKTAFASAEQLAVFLAGLGVDAS